MLLEVDVMRLPQLEVVRLAAIRLKAFPLKPSVATAYPVRVKRNSFQNPRIRGRVSECKRWEKEELVLEAEKCRPVAEGKTCIRVTMCGLEDRERPVACL